MRACLTSDHGVLSQRYSQDWIKTFVELFKARAVATNERGFQEWNTLSGSNDHDFFVELLAQIGFTNEFGTPIIMSLKLRSNHMQPHCDYPLTDNFGSPYKSYLIPLNNFGSSSTVLFNQRSKDIMGQDALDNIVERFPVLPDDENACALSTLEHVSNAVLRRLSVKKVLPWSPNSILFWDSDLLHCSCAYDQKFGASRDAVIIWTVKNQSMQEEKNV